MKTFLNWLSDNYITTLSILLFIFLSYAAIGCEPKVASLLTPDLKVTRGQLQIELETLKAQFAERSANLEQQEALRNFILKNALLIAQAGTINPIGLLTGLAAFYGIGSAGTSVVKKIKKIKNNSLSP